MRVYVVIDTNVLVSAMLKWSSGPGNILEFAFSGTIIPVLSNEKKILDEVKKDIQDDGLILDDADLDKVAGGWKVRWA